MRYDVAIIGAGTAGIYAAYELTMRAPSLKVVVLESGHDIYSRGCPIVEGKTKTCVGCKPCAIMSGFGGAGAFSDGKYNFTTEFGGWLGEYIGNDTLMELINYVDMVNVKFGATTEVFSTDTPAADELRKKALGFDLHLLQAKCKHLGTERNRTILSHIYEYLKDFVEFRFLTHVDSISKLNDGYYLQLKDGGVECKVCIAAPGRSGCAWFTDVCRGLDLPMTNNQVDLGVRVELPAKVFDHITDVVYESKLIYRTKQYGDNVRTFCMNPRGQVVSENVDGLITVNGHSYADPSLQSENTNFALLVSNRFTEPFNSPNAYGHHIASLSNMLGGGVLVQRFGDLVRGVRTNPHRLAQSMTKPTLAATPGDLSLVLPKRHMDNIIEMIYALDKLAPGTANYDTLLYGVEVKFYSARVDLREGLETQLDGLYAIGDGAGITRGLAQAGASGICSARAALEKYFGIKNA